MAKRRLRNYKTYDPDKEGFGNPEQWKRALHTRLGQMTTTDKAHQILGTTSNSSPQEIKNAYRKLALKFHPDKNPDNNKHFTEIASAYHTLKSPLTPIVHTQPTRPTTTSDYMPQLLDEITADEIDQYIHDDRYCAQQKFDGHRKIIKVDNNIVSIFNKKGKSTSSSQQIETDALKISQLSPFKSFIIDGEECNDGYHIFDILMLNGTDLRNNSYHRFDEHFGENWLDDLGINSILPVYTAFTTNEKLNLYDNLHDENKEGIIFKLIDGIHHPGYHPDHVKFKWYATASVIVTHHNEKASVGIAAYGTPLIPIGNVTTLGHTKPPIGSIIEVKYLYAYPGGSLYQPTYLGIRTDQYPQDCTTNKLKYKST